MLLLSILPFMGWVTDRQKLAPTGISADTPINNMVPRPCIQGVVLCLTRCFGVC